LHDSNGNVTTIGTGYSITNTVYNWRNLPTSMTKNGTTTYNYRYDHAGLRVYKEEGDDIHTLRGAYGEALATYRDGSLDYWNILRPDGTVIGRRDGDVRLYYIRGHLGSTRTIIDATGGGEQTYDYYPFGLDMPQRMSQTGDYARERFTGHERDEEVGLDYMQARRYAAEFGRFLSVDPLSDDAMQVGLTPYNYTWNNPTNLTDPDGRCPSCIGALIGGSVEFVSQVVVNRSNGDSFTQAVGNVDGFDVIVAAGAGALSGGLSAAKSIGTAARAGLAVTTNIVEGAAKSNLGDQTNEYSASDIAKDGVLGFAGSVGGEIAGRMARNSSEGRRLEGVARRAEDRAERAPSQNNRSNARSTRRSAANYAARRGIVGSSAVTTAWRGVNSAERYNGYLLLNSNRSSDDIVPADNTKVVNQGRHL
jgi:RHS repeat-associated protein